MGPSFEIDTLAFAMAALLCVLCFFLAKWIKTTPPHLLFSDLNSLKLQEKRGRALWARLPHWLLRGAIAFFLFAFIDPHFFMEKSEEINRGRSAPLKSPSEGIAIYLALDQSGSMQEKVTASTGEGQRMSISKIDLLKDVTKKFVEGDPKSELTGRPNDLIGMVAFARVPKVLAPLTLDHQFILDQLAQFDVVKDKDEDGTAIGYAIFKTASIVAATKHYAQVLRSAGKPAYAIKSAVIILVTDGFQDPNGLDQGNRLRTMAMREAAEYAKSQGIRVYIVNVEPKIASEEFSAQRHLMQQVAELTEGKFYLMTASANLSQIYAEIDRLEKSRFPQEVIESSRHSKDQQPSLYHRVSLYPYFIGLGMACLLIAVILQTTWLRKIP